LFEDYLFESGIRRDRPQIWGFLYHRSLPHLKTCHPTYSKMMPDYVTPSTRDSLQGDLAGVGLAELLLFLAQSQRSGRLEVRLRQNLGLALTLIGGRIAAVAGPLAPRLSDSLLTLGAPPQQVAAIGKALSQGKKLWELVVHFPVLRAVQEWRALCALLPWLHYPQGEFAFRAGPAAAAQGVEVPGLVLEATRRLDELGPAPDPLAVWSIPERPGDISAHLRELMPREWRVLSVIDGERPPGPSRNPGCSSLGRVCSGSAAAGKPRSARGPACWSF